MIKSSLNKKEFTIFHEEIKWVVSIGSFRGKSEQRICLFIYSWLFSDLPTNFSQTSHNVWLTTSESPAHLFFEIKVLSHYLNKSGDVFIRRGHGIGNIYWVVYRMSATTLLRDCYLLQDFSNSKNISNKTYAFYYPLLL